MNSFRVITPPAFLAVSMTEAKLHLNAADFTDHDTVIEIYLKAAIAAAQNFMGRSLVDQVIDMSVDQFPSTRVLQLLRPPIIEIQSSHWRDGAGAAEVEFGESNYGLDLYEGRMYLNDGASWPSVTGSFPNQGRIRYRAGFIQATDESPQDMSALPDEVKSAVLLTLGTLYANREDIVIGQSVVKIPLAAQDLMRDLRVETAIG